MSSSDKMPIDTDAFEVQVLESVKAIPESQWWQLVPEGFPFADPGYLWALEDSNCIGEGTGWIPLYITLWEQKRLIGASCLYLKQDSYGEYIFDWQWANAYHRHGIQYYPKLLCAVPFTPATGPKLLAGRAKDRLKIGRRLVEESKKVLLGSGASSLHFLFIPEVEVPVFEAEGFLIRHSFQYHWRNRAYQDFDHFLQALKTRKAKQIQKERRELSAEGLRIKIFSGSDLKMEHAGWMHDFYCATIAKMGAIAYLNREFFEAVFGRLASQIVFVVAFRGARPIAGALAYRKQKILFGRHWGAVEDVRNLHFELCYYQLLEYAIGEGIELFEGGAQGEHKVSRGFEPALTYSAHLIPHPAFREAIADFIERERQAIEAYFSEQKTHSAYRK